MNCYEVVHKFQRRQWVNRFCQNILYRKNKAICDVINEQDLDLTKGSFEDSFRSVCDGRLKMKPASPSYIIVFAFAMKLNSYHILHSKAWYETDLLTFL